MKNILLAFLFLTTISVNAQRTYWQQAAAYDMTIDMDVEANRFTGTQTLRYTNNSPDTLDRFFYHLFFNAFQPGSMMDERSRTIKDPDRRVGDRISKLKDDEIGYQRVTKLLMKGKSLPYQVEGTVLEVDLLDPILPGETVTFDMEFNAQVPLQIRRSGRDNAEGIHLSMTQWYPRPAEYDYMGWHANPYIGREFYGIFGTYDVKINIDAGYVLGATGNLQNPQEIGMGYEKEGTTVNTAGKEKLQWHFVAENVHDFAWSADPNYKHIHYTRKDGVTVHFLYQPGDQTTDENWQKLPEIMDKALDFMETKYGQYPYKQYTIAQGGDGGMEYPMITLITGKRNLGSLVGVSVHELFHSWYQGVLGINESLYPWMDEGFTSFASAHTMNYLKAQKLIPGDPVNDPIAETVNGMINYNKSGNAEPLTTHADHYSLNSAYSVASYVKGSAFLQQLNYIVGKAAFDRAILRFYNTWKFKHPTPNDLIRIMEKESGLELDWFKEYFVYTTKLPDYAVTDIRQKDKKLTTIQLENKGGFPMPLDVLVTYKNGNTELFHIPLQIMRGEKADEGTNANRTVLPDWGWVYKDYEFDIRVKAKKIQAVQIDPTGRMADTDTGNNKMAGRKAKKKK